MRTKTKAKTDKINIALLKQALRIIELNKKKGSAHTKNRSQVKGGGRKPFKQKGTGRARAGSIRSPLWRGGGTVFGPNKEKLFKRRLPKKVKQSALANILKLKENLNQLSIVPSFEIKDYKTKTALDFIAKLPLENVNNLLLIPKDINANLMLACNNLPNVKIITAQQINTLDLYGNKHVVIEKSALDFLTSKAENIKEIIKDKK